jgi:hypothetical protein
MQEVRKSWKKLQGYPHFLQAKVQGLKSYYLFGIIFFISFTEM